jgi:methionine-rich copper-binding protein CopC
MLTRATTRMLALAAVLAVAAVAAMPAFAHAPVLGTSPKNGATVSTVRTVSVRFGEAVVTGLISVKKSNGTTVKPEVSGLANGKKRLRATFATKLPTGKYTASWRALADDGHHEHGTFRFTVR